MCIRTRETWDFHSHKHRILFTFKLAPKAYFFTLAPNAYSILQASQAQAKPPRKRATPSRMRSQYTFLKFCMIS